MRQSVIAFAVSFLGVLGLFFVISNVSVVTSSFDLSPGHVIKIMSGDDTPIVGDLLTQQLIQKELSMEELPLQPDEVGRDPVVIPEYLSSSNSTIRIAFYIGRGASTVGKENIPKVLKCEGKRVKIHYLGQKSMKRVTNDRYDVVVFPGGSAGVMYNAMAKAGSYPKTTMQRFVKNGGGYVGFCAGAYLAVSNRGLDLSAYSFRGGLLGDGFFSETALDESFDPSVYNFPVKSTDFEDQRFFYANGPVFLNHSTDVTEVKTNPRPILRAGGSSFLKIYVGRHGKSTKRSYQGRPIVVASDFGKGTVVISTGHPETDVTKMSWSKWSKPTRMSKCSSVQAKLLRSLLFVAARRKRWD